MITYALDTNIVSYFLKNNYGVQDRVSLEKNMGNSFVIPPTVYFEIRNWLVKNNSKKKMILFEQMYLEKGIGVIDQDVLDIASDAKLKLQKQGKGMSDDDLFIAAYCIKHNLPLVTNNIRHFTNIKNLEILNWVE